MKISIRAEIIVLSVFLLLGFILRLYRFDSPIADWHSWRQADTSSVSRNFVNSGFDILHPKFDDLSNVASGLDNPQGYRFVEFPIYNLFQAGLFKTIGILTLEEWGRLVTIFSSLLTSVFLYLIFRQRKKSTLGLMSAFFFLFVPFNIYYGRTILADTSMAMAVMGAIYFFQRWIENKKISIINLNFLISVVFMICALLLKPYAIFFILPLLALSYERLGLEMFKNWKLWFFAIASVIPLIFWRTWMTNFPQGIPSSNWLFNGNAIRFRPSFFRWIFYERLTKLVSGYLGIIIFIAGIISLRRFKDLLFISSFGIGSLLYITTLATGNVQHDYYQILVMPSVSIFFALGSIYLFNFKFKNIEAGKIVLTFCILSLFIFGWSQVKDYFNINNPSIIVAGAAVDKLTPKDANVIANYNGDTSFLYQTKRKGWASFEKPMNEMIGMGADFLVLANPTKADLEIGKQYKILKATSEYVIFNLSQKP